MAALWASCGQTAHVGWSDTGNQHPTTSNTCMLQACVPHNYVEKTSGLTSHLWGTYGLCKHGLIGELNPWLRAQALCDGRQPFLFSCICSPEVEFQGLAEHVFLRRGQTIDACNVCTLQDLLDKSQHLHKQQVKTALQKRMMHRMMLQFACHSRLDCCIHTARNRHHGRHAAAGVDQLGPSTAPSWP